MDRICMVALSFYPDDPRVRREAEALEARGIGVDVICIAHPGQPRTESFGAVRAFRVAEDRPKESIARYVFASIAFLLAALFQLRRLDRGERYRLVQVHNMPDYLVFAAIFQKLRGCPIVLDLHDLMVELFEAKWGGRKSRLLLPAVRLVERISCGFADHLITASDGFRERLSERGVPRERINLVLNSPDPTLFRFNAERRFEEIRRGARLLYHGTITARYGLHTAIEAMPHLLEHIPDSSLLIHGKADASYLEELLSMIERLGLGERVTVGSWRSLEEIAQIIEDVDIGVVPHRLDAFTSLAIPTKALEYGAAGLPIVASRLAPLEAIFDDDCVAFSEPEEPRSLADRIISLCREPERRRLQSRAAVRAVERQSWDVMAARYTELITGSWASGAGA